MAFRSLRSSDPEELLRVPDAVRQRVDFLAGVVEVQARPGTRLHAHGPVQRPGAVVTSPDRHAAVVEHLADVVRMQAVERERDRAAAVDRLLRAEDPQPVDFRQGRQRVTAGSSCSCAWIWSGPTPVM